MKWWTVLTLLSVDRAKPIVAQFVHEAVEQDRWALFVYSKLSLGGIVVTLLDVGSLWCRPTNTHHPQELVDVCNNKSEVFRRDIGGSSQITFRCVHFYYALHIRTNMSAHSGARTHFTCKDVSMTYRRRSNRWDHQISRARNPHRALSWCHRPCPRGKPLPANIQRQ